MRNIIKSMIFVIALSVLLTAPQSVSAKTGKGISIEKTFAKGTRDEISRKVYDKNQDGYLSKNEIKKIKELKLYSYLNANIENKLNLKGISKLKYLEKIYFDAFGRIYNLKEISKLRNLKDVEIRAKLKKKRVLDFRKCKNIRTLKLWLPYKKGILKLHKNNRIKYLDLTGIRNSITVGNICNKAESINIKGNFEKKKLNINNQKHLKNIYLYNVKTDKNINIQNCPKLKSLMIECVQCKGVNIKKTGSSGKVKMLELITDNCCIEEASGITSVDISGKSVEKIKIDNLKNLKILSLDCIKLSEISMKGLESLRTVKMYDIKRLKTITFKDLSNLREIEIRRVKYLKTLTIENTPRLKTVSCTWGRLRELNISGKNKIEEMKLYNNQLKKFEYSNLKSLSDLDIDNNEIEGRFDFSLYPELYRLDCQNNKITEIYGGKVNHIIDYIDCNNNQIKCIDFRGTDLNKYYIFYIDCRKNPNIVVYAAVEDFVHDATAKLDERQY